MIISVKRSGGFAGLSEDLGTINSTQLNTALVQQVEQWVQDMDFFTLPATVSGSEIGADLFCYEITIHEGNQQHTVAFYDDGSAETAPLRQLVEFVTQMG